MPRRVKAPSLMNIFLVPEGLDPANLAARLGERFRLEAEPEHGLERRFHDTFDWRLYHAARVLEEERVGRRSRLVLRQLGSAEPLRVVQDATPPRFAWDLPPDSPLRDELEPLLGIRALLELVRCRIRTRRLRVLDDEGKTLARVDLEEGVYARGSGDTGVEMDPRAVLVPVKGYDEALDGVRDHLERQLGLVRVSADPLVRAAEALGQTPGGYSSKIEYRLDPDQRADAAAKRIHLGLLDTLESNISGTRAGLDTEFLHDLRVATRRTRSALTQIKGVFDPETVERFKEGFAWLGQITGPTRDLDVYLLAFPGYRDSLPASVRDDLEPLHEFLQRHQRLEHKRLARHLGSARFRGLLADWRAFLEAPVPEGPGAPNAGRPVREVADRRIRKMYRRVCREGRAIVADSPAEELHELRKSCKKLRYLMEFFRSLYDEKEITRLIKVVKVLLDNLGAHQDYQVQAHKLHGYAEQMAEEGRAPPGTLLAMGALVGGIWDRQHAAREEFAERFAEFDAKGNRKAFRDLFGAGKGKDKR